MRHRSGDSLNGVLWHDDSAIADARIVKRYGEAAELVVEVEEMFAGEAA